MSTATELLRRALDWIEYDPELVEEIRVFLAAEPEAEDPKDRDDPNVPNAWIDWDEDGYAFITIEGSGVPVYFHPPKASESEADKPVAWMRTTPNGDQIVAFHKTDGFEPLYTRPSPSRKPMELPNMGTPEYLTFVAGVRRAERHHGIGVEE